METFKFEVTLVSELIEFANSPDALLSDPYESFDYYFRNFGGTELLYDASPCLKPGINPPSEDNCFSGLEWDSELEAFDGALVDYEIKNITGQQKSGWDYSYHLLITFFAETLAATLEEARSKIINEAFNCLAIYDGGIDESIEVEDVRLIYQSNK